MPVGRPRPPWRTRGIDRLPRGLVCPDAPPFARSRCAPRGRSRGRGACPGGRDGGGKRAEWFVGEVHAEGEADRVLPETESAGHKATPSNQRIP